MTTDTDLRLSRRNVLRYGVATGAAAAAGPALLAAPAHADGGTHVQAAPKPIPGGLTLPGGIVIHVFPPGPTTVTLPFTGVQLAGLDVDPSVITDFTGFSAVAFHVGSATGSDGKRYNLETDMRVMEGTYVAADGTRADGLFGFV
jgi:hypothetical protein